MGDFAVTDFIRFADFRVYEILYLEFGETNFLEPN